MRLARRLKALDYEEDFFEWDDVEPDDSDAEVEEEEAEQP